MGLRADEVVFYPTPNVLRAVSNARERVSGGLGRPRPGHLASLSGAHSPVSSAEACLICVSEVGKARERRWDERPQHSYHFLFFLIIAIITGIPSGSLYRGERRGAPERETRNDWGALAPV